MSEQQEEYEQEAMDINGYPVGTNPEPTQNQPRTNSEPEDIEDVLSLISDKKRGMKWTINKINPLTGKFEVQRSGEGPIGSLEEIGCLFGGGDYKLRWYEKGNSRDRKSRSFTLAAHYDTLAKEYWGRKRGVSAPVQVSPSSSNNMDMFVMMKEMIGMITPLIAANNQNQVGTPEHIIRAYQGVDTILQQQVKTNLNFYKNLTQNVVPAFGQPMQQEEEIMEENGSASFAASLIAGLMPMLEQFLPTILGGGVGGKAVTSMIKKSDEYKMLCSDEEALQMVVAHLVAEKGEEVTNQLLEKLGITKSVDAAEVIS